MAKKEGVPGGGQGGRAPARHWLDLPLWFPAGGCVLPRLFFMSYNRFFAPIPLPPLPSGKGETKVIFMQGASPLASPGLNPRGIGSTCQSGIRPGGEPSASPVRRKTDRNPVLRTVPPAKERGDRGRWNYPSQATAAFEMVLSPGAGRTSAARGVAPPPVTCMAGSVSAAGGLMLGMQGAEPLA